MKSILVCLLLTYVSSANAQSTGTNSSIHNQEAIEKQKAADRQESANTEQALKPNAKDQPTKVDVSKWGLNENVEFEIVNHLLGCSTIIENDQTLTGVKVTGLINIAYYQLEKKTETGRSRGRFIFGIEFPLYDLSKRTQLWSGVGLTLGDTKALYVDLGLEYYLMSWFKIQAGFNYNAATETYPQVSAGFVW